MSFLRNPRHEKFCELVASGVKPSDAYVALGYSKNGAKQGASRLLANAIISTRISEIIAKSTENAVEKLHIDRERVLNRLDVLSRQAEAKGNFSAAVRAEELIGKALGMFIDRSEGEFTFDGDLSKLSEDQMSKFVLSLEQIAARRDPAWYAEYKKAKALGSSASGPDSEPARESLRQPDEPVH